MRRLVPTLVAAAGFVVAMPSYAADFDAGMTAARAGDFAVAFQEWKPLADAGHVRAQVNLAEMYEAGMGVALDYVEAARLYRAAAENGHGPGQYRWALALQTGAGVAKDAVAAMDWLQKAVAQHVPAAIYEMGYAYHEGDGVPVDLVEAMKWFVIADEYGFAEAYPAGTHTADRLTESEVMAAVQAAAEWMTNNPRP